MFASLSHLRLRSRFILPFSAWVSVQVHRENTNHEASTVNTQYEAVKHEHRRSSVCFYLQIQRSDSETEVQASLQLAAVTPEDYEEDLIMANWCEADLCYI